MARTPIALIARVECRSGSTGEEKPLAVWIGGDRREIEQVIDDAVIGSACAGDPNRRRVTVRLDDGQRLQLLRLLPDGEWRVTLL